MTAIVQDFRDGKGPSQGEDLDLMTQDYIVWWEHRRTPETRVCDVSASVFPCSTGNLRLPQAGAGRGLTGLPGWAGWAIV